MRLFIISAALLFSLATTAVAQSRWTVSAGPEWAETRVSWGLRLRADYDLLRQDRPFQLRLQGGGRWGPTHQYNGSYAIVGGSFAGEEQTVDLTFGVVAAISPLPRARFSPYVTGGVLGRQEWSRGWSFVTYSDGSSSGSRTPRSWTYGDVFFVAGVGTRARLGGRMFQLEFRRFPFSGLTNGLTLGTTLPF